MSDWVKGDGAKIKITFDYPLVGDVSGNQAAFIVTVPEYTYVPGGVITYVEKTVASTYAFVGIEENIDISSGALTDVVVTDGVLGLSGVSDGTCNYNSEQLPQIPTVSGYSYVCIRKDTVNSRFDAIYSNTPFYYSGSLVYTTGGAACPRYTLPLSKSGSWTYMDTYYTSWTQSDTRNIFWSLTNISNGSGSSTIWLAGSAPVENITYDTSGNATFTVTGITATVTVSSISWTESKPDGTTLTVSVSTNGTNFSAVAKGGTLLSAGTVLDNATIYIKVEMSTTDTATTPTLSDLAISLQSTADTNSVVLEMQPLERFESAAGPITVAYNGGGTLVGEGGAVQAFTRTFTPADLVPKPDQNDAEHIEISNITATGTLTQVYYTNAQNGGEHIEITGITATGTLTHVDDI